MSELDPFAEPLPAALAARWRALVSAAHGGPPLEGDEDPLTGLYGPLVGRRTLVLAQLGQSLDGHVATSTGHSHYVTGPASLVHLHRLRALVDAVVVGWRTALADDPRLTVRRVEGPDPARVVLDARDELPLERALFEADGRVVRVVAAEARDVRARAGTEVLRVPAPRGRFDPHEVVAALAAAGLPRILVEGGGRIVSSFLGAGALDRLHVAVAPLVTGEGLRGLGLPGVASLEHALRPPARVRVMGEDALFDLDLSR